MTSLVCQDICWLIMDCLFFIRRDTVWTVHALSCWVDGWPEGHRFGSTQCYEGTLDISESLEGRLLTTTASICSSPLNTPSPSSWPVSEQEQLPSAPSSNTAPGSLNKTSPSDPPTTTSALATVTKNTSTVKRSKRSFSMVPSHVLDLLSLVIRGRRFISSIR